MRLRITIAALTVVTALAAAAQQAPLEPLPYPALGDHDERVREQMQAVRSRLDELLARPETPPTELAEAFGDVGRLYHLYDLDHLAVVSFRNAEALAPGDYRWPYYLGAALTYQGLFEEAAVALERAAALRPADLPTHVRLGDLRLELHDMEAGEASYRRVLELDPDCAAAIYGLGRVAYYAGDLATAVERFERALALQPEATSIHQLLGMAYRRLGELEQARHHLELNRDNLVRFPDPLIDSLGQLIRSSHVYFKAGVEALKKGEFDTAIANFEVTLRDKPDDHLAHYNLAMALLQKGELEAAKQSFRAAVELEPDFRNGHLNLATVLAGEGNFHEAAYHFGRAHEIDPANLSAHLEWTVALTRIGQKERAAGELGKILERDPQSARAWLYLGTLDAQRGDRQTAREELERVLELDATASDRAEAHQQLGALALGRGDYPGSLRHYELAVELDPEAVEARLALAQGLGRAGRFAESARQFGAVVEASPERAEAHFGRGLALLLAEDYPAARRGLEESLARRPEDAPLRHLLARLLAACPDAAVRDGARALELAGELFRDEQTLEHAQTLAMALAELGRFDEAIELQRQVVSQAEQRGGGTAERRRLMAYQRGEPARAPWKGP